MQPRSRLPDLRRCDGERDSRPLRLSPFAPIDRRRFLQLAAGGAAGLALPSAPWLLAEEEAAKPAEALPPDLVAVGDRSAKAPTSPVAIERCRSYELAELSAAMGKLFESLGGLEKLVRGKRVAIKLNITGDGRSKMARLPAERSFQTHPAMVEVLCRLLAQSGARQITLLESYYREGLPQPEEILASHGWDVARLKSSSEQRLQLADTRHRGGFKDYAEIAVPYGGYVFPKFLVNHHYVDTDFFISLAKLKNHITAGFTAAVKNLFGMAPTSLYGNDAPNEQTVENRGSLLHDATRRPPAGVPGEARDPPAELLNKGPRMSYFRVPRVTADLFAARPVDLAIVDGVETVSGGEGPWCPPPHKAQKAGLVIAGRNGVTTDAVCVGVMGYDPLSGFGDFPCPGENHLRLLARGGVGTNDLARIEVRGLPLAEALHEFHPGRGPPGRGGRHLLKG